MHDVGSCGVIVHDFLHDFCMILSCFSRFSLFYLLFVSSGLLSLCFSCSLLAMSPPACLRIAVLYCLVVSIFERASCSHAKRGFSRPHVFCTGITLRGFRQEMRFLDRRFLICFYCNSLSKIMLSLEPRAFLTCRFQGVPGWGCRHHF